MTLKNYKKKKLLHQDENGNYFKPLIYIRLYIIKYFIPTDIINIGNYVFGAISRWKFGPT